MISIVGIPKEALTEFTWARRRRFTKWRKFHDKRDTLASLSGYFIPLGHDAMFGLYRNVLAPGHRGAYR